MSNKDKGFASMDKDKVKEIASKGGQTSHKGSTHDNDHDKEDQDTKNDKNEG